MKNKQKKKLKYWNKKLGENLKLFNQVISFLKKNHEFTDVLFHKSAKKLIPKHLPAREKLYFIFIDCLGAAGGNNLTNSGEASEKFVKLLSKLPNSKLIYFKTFLSHFSDKPKNTEQLFNSLTDGSFPNFREKKGALFMKELYFCQKIITIKIFKDLKPENIYKPIPLDAIIADLINKILKLKNKINRGDFLIFNDWAKCALLDDYYILEDLWFWGYFSTRVIRGKERTVKYNKAKYLTNPWVYPIQDKSFLNKINKFCKFF